MGALGWMVFGLAAILAVARLASRHEYFVARAIDRLRGFTLAVGLVLTLAFRLSPLVLIPWLLVSQLLPVAILLLAPGELGDHVRKIRGQAKIMGISFEDLLHQRNASKGSNFEFVDSDDPDGNGFLF